MSTPAERKRVIENFKKGILTEGFDVYHCATVDKYIIRKRKDFQGNTEETAKETEPVRKKWGSFIC